MQKLNLKHEFNATLAIGQRDFLKFIRDRNRIVATFIFPFIFIAVLGGSLQANFSSQSGYNFMLFTFTGVLAQTMFQSTASGIISLIEDRQSDFSREIFVSPISRYTIVIGKIIGESSVAFAQAIGVILFALILGVPISISHLIMLFPVSLVCCLLGGSFGILILGNLNNQRAANQIFPFVIFPQFFLSGVFSPIMNLPFYLDILSKLAPMRYAVDFARGLFYQGNPDYDKVVLFHPLTNLAIIALMIVVFLIIGTYMFVSKEKNR